MAVITIVHIGSARNGNIIKKALAIPKEVDAGDSMDAGTSVDTMQSTAGDSIIFRHSSDPHDGLNWISQIKEQDKPNIIFLSDEQLPKPNKYNPLKSSKLHPLGIASLSNLYTFIEYLNTHYAIAKDSPLGLSLSHLAAKLSGAHLFSYGTINHPLLRDGTFMSYFANWVIARGLAEGAKPHTFILSKEDALPVWTRADGQANINVPTADPKTIDTTNLLGRIQAATGVKFTVIDKNAPKPSFHQPPRAS